MMHRSLFEHCSELLYGCPQLASLLWEQLEELSSNHPQLGNCASSDWLVRRFAEQLTESVDTRYPRCYRLTDIRRLVDELLLCPMTPRQDFEFWQLQHSGCDVRHTPNQLFVSSTLPLLSQLFQELFYQNGDFICYRENKVVDYTRLAAGLDPNLLVGSHLAEYLHLHPEMQWQDLERIISQQQHFFAPKNNPILPVAEGHLHVWGSTLECAILFDHLTGRKEFNVSPDDLWRSSASDALAGQLTRTRALLRFLLQAEVAACNQNTDEANGKLLKLLQETLFDPLLHSIRLPDWRSLYRQTDRDFCFDQPLDSQMLLHLFAKSMWQQTTNNTLWLQTYLCHLYQQHQDPLVRMAIVCFFQYFNALRRSLIMDGQGLTRFVERFSAAPLGRGDWQSVKTSLHGVFTGDSDVAELKAGIQGFDSEFALNISCALPKATVTPPYIFGEHDIPISAVVRQHLQTLERWHYCGHFIRTARAGLRNGQVPDVGSIWAQAKATLQNLNKGSGWNLPEFYGGHLNDNFQFQPARWYRGLDVAGDENSVKTEWYAPAIRWLRRGLLPRPQGEVASAGFHLSVHAGEDYAHPLSGLRHIDETVRFCEMREGDRLGHALALGIRPADWLQRHGDVVLPLDEHLDNLVWCWHYASKLSGALTLASQVEPMFRRRINQLLRYCPWQLLHLEQNDTEQQKETRDQYRDMPEYLLQSWLLRRNCNYQLKKMLDGGPWDSAEQIAVPDFRLLHQSDDYAAQLYKARHLLLSDASYQMPLVRLSSSDLANVSDYLEQRTAQAKTATIRDQESPAEIDFIEALQDYLLDQYDSFGLIIETNPTSNIYVSRLRCHSEHPIFRWAPPDESVLEPNGLENRFGLRRGPIRVLVNTDDPGIMPTTLRTEFLLLREAARMRGISRTVAEKWLESLRQYGMEQFYRNHLPVFLPNNNHQYNE